MWRRAHPNSRVRRLPITAGLPALKLVGVVLIYACPVATGATGNAPASEAHQDARAGMLVAAIVDGSETGSMEILRDGDGFLIPLPALSAILDLRFAPADAATMAHTPLGDVRIPAHRITDIDGVPHIHSAYLAEALLTETSFDERRYSLTFRLPWDSRRVRQRGERLVVPREVDVSAPGSTLSGLQARMTRTRYGEQESLYGSLRLDGRLQGGLWRVWLQDSDESDLQIREYQWYIRKNRTHYQVGRQQLQLHPELSSFDLAGLQVGWSNRRQEEIPTAHATNSLFPRSARPMETFHGSAPPASFVQLRVDGRIVGSQQVGFSGIYDFYDVALPSRQATQIEVAIFDPNNLRIPVEIRRHRLASSSLLLSKGVVTHTAGLGVAGRFNQGFFDADSAFPGGAGGFYQWRDGLTPNVTAEASIQYAGEKAQLFSGVVTRLDDAWVLGVGLTHTPGSTGYSMDLDGFLTRWRIFARASSVPREFGLTQTKQDRFDHSIEAEYDVNSTLNVGLVARQRNDGTRLAEYIRPKVVWRPIPEVRLDARPDLFGDYLINGSWEMNHVTRARVFARRSVTAEVSRDLNRRYQVGLQSDFGGGLDTRYTLFASRLAANVRGWSFKAGLVNVEDRFGYMLTANTPVLPGVYMRGEYQSIPLTTIEGTPGGRFMLSVATDLSHSGGRFVPAEAQTFRRGRGAVAGKLRLDRASAELLRQRAASFNLGDIKIIVDKRLHTRTDAGGRYYLGDLDEGFHVVELDPDQLSIELNPVRTMITVEVAAGAVTVVDFPVRPELGVAGRVTTPDGTPQPDVLVELMDESGRVLSQARTDQFGLYRIDGIPPGWYTLRARRTAGDAEILDRRPIVLNDFLFDQNLVIPAETEPNLIAGG